MHYSICIRRQLGFCSILYEENGPNGFRLSPLVNQRCSDAYVLIPTGSTGSVRDGNLGDRICGTTFTPVAANVTPFRLSFITGPRVGYSDCPCPGVRPNTPVLPNPSTVIVNPPQVQPNPPQVQPNPAVVVNPPVVQPNPAVVVNPPVVQPNPAVVNPPVVQPNPAVVVNPPVVQPNPAVVVNPPVVQPNPTVVVNPPVVQPNPTVVVNPSPQVLPTQPQLPIGSQLPAGLGSTAANVTQFAGREFTERQFADALVCRAGGFSLKYTQLPYGC
nr:proline-rich extensin-like protein EPR1 isoform X1 [Rhipicephalus microplus]